MNGPLIDGKPGTSVHCTDRGLQYGDGLFETMSCCDGRVRWLAFHFERLREGLQRLRLPFVAFDELQAEINGLAADQARCLIKVIVTRGASTRRGYAPVGDEKPTRIVSRHSWPTSEPLSDGFRVGVSPVRFGSNPLLAGLKHLNRLEQVLAQMDCTARGLSEVVMLSATQGVISGSMSNVFLADERGLITPELRDCGVAGVMRRVVLHAAEALRLPVQIRAVAVEELSTAREAFVTNVRLGVQPVHWLDGRAIDRDLYTRQLQRHIDASTD